MISTEGCDAEEAVTREHPQLAECGNSHPASEFWRLTSIEVQHTDPQNGCPTARLTG